MILQKAVRSARRWTSCVRGDVCELRAPRNTKRQEQPGRRYAVILQSDDLFLSTLLVAPTSRSAKAASFRPEILIAGERTYVLVEQTTAVAPERLGLIVSRLSRSELMLVDDALRLVFALD
jgi:mRNA interferase MazF